MRGDADAEREQRGDATAGLRSCFLLGLGWESPPLTRPGSRSGWALALRVSALSAGAGAGAGAGLGAGAGATSGPALRAGADAALGVVAALWRPGDLLLALGRGYRSASMPRSPPINLDVVRLRIVGLDNATWFWELPGVGVARDVRALVAVGAAAGDGERLATSPLSAS